MSERCEGFQGWEVARLHDEESPAVQDHSAIFHPIFTNQPGMTSRRHCSIAALSASLNWCAILILIDRYGTLMRGLGAAGETLCKTMPGKSPKLPTKSLIVCGSLPSLGSANQ
jgi:hypothetical protein